MQRQFFFRLSKTGSTTLAALIVDQVSPEATCPSVFQHEITSLPPEQLAKYKFIHGHIDLSFMEQRFPDLSVMTLLREPKTRILSAYFRWRERVEEQTVPLHESAIPTGNLSLEEYLSSGDEAIHRSIKNFQARLLAGATWGTNHFQHQQAFGPKLSDHEIIDHAKASLDRMTFVGVTKRMNQVVEALFDQFGWTLPEEIPQLNVTLKKDKVISQKAEALLAEHTELDQIVYEHAVNLFESRHAL